MEDNKSYKLDKTVFSAMTFEEADDHVSYWQNKSESERLNAACFIINQIFQVTPSTKLDVSITDKRKHQ
jgi:translation initiation factor 2B subunit (eIF-2B alpha/beta/delta family)